MVPQATRCECGCGGEPKSGRFLPGHDSKLKSRLLQTMRKAEDAKEQKKAEKELIDRGWWTPEQEATTATT